MNAMTPSLYGSDAIWHLYYLGIRDTRGLGTRDFLRPAPSYVFIRDPVRRLCHRMIVYNISGRGAIPVRHAEGRKSGARLSRARGPERQPDAAAGAPRAAKDAPAVDEGAQADPAPVQELRRSVMGLRGDVSRSIIDQGRFATWMVSCMTQLMDASSRTYQAFDSTLIGSSQFP
nr:hypothetical protein [Tanacetum cinerariifolium]